jgi:tRNA A-37 threonylcarbamoyl transferase component Bud32
MAARRSTSSHGRGQRDSAVADDPGVERESGLEAFGHDGLRWLAARDAGCAVRSLSGWPDLPSAGFQVLERRRDRAVLAGSLAFGDEKRRVVVKTSRSRRLQHHVLHMVGPTRAAREWRNHREALAAGLPVVTPLALGERYRFGTPVSSVLVTEYWEHEGTLAAISAAPAAAPLMAPLLVELGEVVHRMHAAGLLHGDLHPGNVLVRLHGADRLRVLDWKHVNWRRERSAGPRGQLAKLVWQFRLAGVFSLGEPSLEDAFFQGYFAGEAVPAWRAEIEDFVCAAGDRLAERAARRCTSSNSTFTRCSEDGLVLLLRNEPGFALLPAPLRSAQALLASARGGARVLPAGAGHRAVLRHVRAGSGEQPAQRAWQEINREHALHASARLPLAWIESAGSPGEGWLVWIEPGQAPALETEAGAPA